MSNIKIIQLSGYVSPKIEENKGKNWVQNGKDNSFYQYIIDRNNGSATNAAINKAYIDLIYGRGLYARDASHKPNQWASVISIIKPQELKKIVADFQLFGEASMQVIKTKSKKKISGIYHIPKNLVIPSIENEEGEITSYWFSKNWKKLSANPPIEVPAFGTSNDEIEIYVIKPYTPGCNYFANPDYLPGLQYAKLEEEISNHCMSAIENGLSVGYVINFPDGQTLTPEEKDTVERKIKQQLTGSSNASKFIVSFSSKDSEPEVKPMPVNDNQHKQWEFLQGECKQQIMTAHRVVSPMLVGIKDSTGLGNNADELDTAEAQLVKRVIAPKQQYIIDALQDILFVNGITLDLYFKPLTDTSHVALSRTAAAKEIQENIQKHLAFNAPIVELFLKSMMPLSLAQTITVESEDEKKNPVTNLDTTVADALIDMGEDEPGDEWELVEKVIVHDYETELSLASTGTAIPNAKSTKDGKLFKSRYRYIGQLSANSREFCRKMIAANKLYRLEDINKMSVTVVNEGWGPRGADTYDIFLYKGGGNCKHAWQRESYRLKADVYSPLADKVTPAEARKAGEILPVIDKLAATKPADMPNNGFLPK